MGHTPHTRAHAPNRIGPGSGQVDCAYDMQTWMQLCSRGSWTCYILNLVLIFWVVVSDWQCLVSEYWGSIVMSWRDNSVLGIIPEYLDSGWSRSVPEHVISERPSTRDLGVTPSSWTQDHPRALGLGVSPSSVSLFPRYFTADYCFDL